MKNKSGISHEFYTHNKKTVVGVLHKGTLLWHIFQFRCTSFQTNEIITKLTVLFLTGSTSMDISEVNARSHLRLSFYIKYLKD